MNPTTTIENGIVTVATTYSVADYAVIVQDNITEIESEINNKSDVLSSLNSQVTSTQSDISDLQTQLAAKQALLAQLQA